MTDRPKLLDLYCCAGGAGMGYFKAGFEVTGVDINPQPDYPFDFIQADALEVDLSSYDCYHASPPCFENTWAARKAIHQMSEIPFDRLDRVKPTRERLLREGKPFVLENTPGAEMSNYIRLKGTMFGLRVIRERWFELHGFNIWFLPCPEKPKNPIASGKYVTVAGHGGDSRDCTLKTARLAMGIDWMDKKHLNQAIPPAYTEFIGKYLMEAILNN